VARVHGPLMRPDERPRVPPRQAPERLVAGPRRGERTSWPKGGVESRTEGARARAATSREACSLDRGTMREPSRAGHGEGHVRGAEVRSGTRRESCRGMGRSTCSRLGEEQERPVCAARVSARWLA
jgi:hypothetical protein